MFKIIVVEISMLLILSSLSSFDISLSASVLGGPLVLGLFKEEVLFPFMPKSGGASAFPTPLLSDDWKEHLPF